MADRAEYAGDVPLICDPVPGPGGYAALRQGVVIAERTLMNGEIEELRREWERANATGGTVVLLPDDVSFRAVFEPAQWPDAEFCAA